MPSPRSPHSAFRTAVTPIDAVTTDLLFVPVFGPDDLLDDLPGVDAAVGGEWRRACAAGTFGRKPYATTIGRVVSGYRATHVCFIGVGERDDADDVRWRRVAAACGYIARQRRVATCAWVVRRGVDVAAVAGAAADGLSAAEFDGGRYRTREDARPVYPTDIDIVAAPGTEATVLAGAVARGRVIGRAVNAARDLANEPANVLTPAVFASRVEALVADTDLAVDVLDEAQLQRLGMGLHLAVARGSAEPPRLVVLRHEPDGVPEGPVVALVGKGVTFDTGGVSIKPSENMDRMKADMGGGAAVAAAMWAIATLGVRQRVIGLIPMAENMVGGRAYRPGDVLTGANGRTVEVLNTDAEGRLVLADALWYAGQQGATHLVDIATLTGHCIIGLGQTVSGLLGTPDDWREQVRAAADRAGERVWPLPIYEEAFDQLRSEIADMTNVGGRAGGAITAAAFLREFTGGLPWAHLDIAGTAWAESKQPYQPKGATGAGVRTLIEVAGSSVPWGRSPRAPKTPRVDLAPRPSDVRRLGLKPRGTEDAQGSEDAFVRGRSSVADHFRSPEASASGIRAATTD